VSQKSKSLKQIFDPDSLLENCPPSYVSFLEDLLKTQTFQMFLEERYSSEPRNTQLSTNCDLFDWAVEHRRKQRSATISILSEKNMRGNVWIYKRSKLSNWKFCSLILDGKSLLCDRLDSFGLCSNTCSSSNFKLLINLDHDLKIRVVNYDGSKKRAPSNYAFRLLSKSNSRRVINLLICIEKEEDYYYWMDIIFSKISRSALK
jgi:hypothetical protein